MINKIKKYFTKMAIKKLGETSEELEDQMEKQIILRRNGDIAVWDETIKDFTFEGSIEKYIETQQGEAHESTKSDIKETYTSLLLGENPYGERQTTYKVARKISNKIHMSKFEIAIGF